jgi:hypothetical protein
MKRAVGKVLLHRTSLEHVLSALASETMYHINAQLADVRATHALVHFTWW